MEIIGSTIARDAEKKYNLLNTKINGFTQIPNSFLMRQDINIYEKMILIILKKFKMKNVQCWPSENTIALNARCSITTVKKAIKGLKNKGLLIKSRDKCHRSNLYNIGI